MILHNMFVDIRWSTDGARKEWREAVCVARKVTQNLRRGASCSQTRGGGEPGRGLLIVPPSLIIASSLFWCWSIPPHQLRGEERSGGGG